MNISDKKKELYSEIRIAIKDAEVPIFVVKEIFGGILKDLDVSTGFADVELIDSVLSRKDFE